MDRCDFYAAQTARRTRKVAGEPAALEPKLFLRPILPEVFEVAGFDNSAQC